LLRRKADALTTASAELNGAQAQLSAVSTEKIELENYVTDAQNRAAGFQIEIANRSAELEALNEKLATLTTDAEISQTDRQRFAGALADIQTQIGGVEGIAARAARASLKTKLRRR
jgi:chromosome segregation ATPase